MALRTVVHRDLASWMSRETAWWSLVARCAWATPFATPAWIIPWWEHFGREKELIAIEVRDGDRSAAMLPLMAYPQDPGAIVSVGGGNTDYIGSLVDASIPGALDHLLAALREQLGRAERAVLDGVQAQDPIASIQPDGLMSHTDEEDRAPRRDLPASLGDWPGCLPHGLKVSLGKSSRRLAREGEVGMRVAHGAEVLPDLESFFALHGRRWSSRGQSGVLDDEVLRRFHRAVARSMDAHGLLRLHTLRLDDRAIAAVYAFALHGTVFGYLGGFDPGFARFGPGQLILAETMRFGIANGDRVFDFLRGTEAYKYQWSAQDRVVLRRVFTKR